MNKIKFLFLAAVLIICTYAASAEDSPFSAALTRTEYLKGDTVYLKISFETNPYAAEFEVGYTPDSLEYISFKTDADSPVYIPDAYINGSCITAAYTKTGQNPLANVCEVLFEFKVIAEKSASVTLKRVTAIDSELGSADFEINRVCTVNISSPVPTPAPSHGGGGGGGGGGSRKPSGSVVLPAATPAPSPEIISSTPAPETVLPFEDISADAWYKDYVSVLFEKNIISSDTRFRPDDGISRAEFIKLLVTAFNIPAVYGTPEFKDCTPGAWYNGYISAAASAGIVNGADGMIYPDESVCRQDICVMLERILKLEAEISLEFTDAEDISGYAADAVKKLCAADIISGLSDGRFDPQGKATRAHAAKMICLALSKYTEGK